MREGLVGEFHLTISLSVGNQGKVLGNFKSLAEISHFGTCKLSPIV